MNIQFPLSTIQPFEPLGFPPIHDLVNDIKITLQNAFKIVSKFHQNKITPDPLNITAIKHWMTREAFRKGASNVSVEVFLINSERDWYSKPEPGIHCYVKFTTKFGTHKIDLFSFLK